MYIMTGETTVQTLADWTNVLQNELSKLSSGLTSLSNLYGLKRSSFSLQTPIQIQYRVDQALNS